MINKIRYISLALLVCIIFSSLTACAIRKIDEAPENTLSENETNDTEAESTEPDTTDIETETEPPATEPPATEPPVTEPPATEPPATEPPATEPPATEPPATEPPATEPPVTEPPVVTTPVSEDCLFIGDSRTVGLQLYSGMDADYFANVGMSIYSIGNATAEVDGLGTVSLDTLMAKKQYKRIFIMLGINEIGSPVTSLLPKYKNLVESIKQKQPNAYIFIEANLHVTNAFTQKSPHINNTALNNYNAELAKLADNQRVFYLDANHLFDDATGQLSSDKSSDGVHYYPKEYIPWSKWLLSQSASLIG